MSGSLGCVGPGRALSSLEVLTALEQLYTSSAPQITNTEDYRPPGGLVLSANVGEVVQAMLGAAGEGSVTTRDSARLACDTVIALAAAYPGKIAGLVSHPPSGWAHVGWVRFAVVDSEEARRWLLDSAAAQALTVEVHGSQRTVPVRPVLARLPPNHVQVIIRHLPFYFARQGVTEALLRGAGYTAGEGVSVVHERAGIPAGPDGERLEGLPVLDTIVAVVRTPPGDGSLRRLPSQLRCGSAELCLTVEGSIIPPHGFVRCPPPPPPPRPPPRVWDMLGQSARAPGCHTGLGFVQAAAAAVPPPPRQPPPPPAAAELPMPPAEPLPALPLDEPVVGTALEYLDDYGQLEREQAEQLVAAVRTHSPAAFRACLNAERVSDLTPQFRFVLYSQAASMWGEAAAEALRPAAGAGAAEEGELGGRDADACLPASVLAEVGRGGGGSAAEHSHGGHSPDSSSVRAGQPHSPPLQQGGQQVPSPRPHSPVLPRAPSPKLRRMGRASYLPGEHWKAQPLGPPAARRLNPYATQANSQPLAAGRPAETGTPGRGRG